MIAAGVFLSGGAACAGESNYFVLPQYSQKVSLDFKNADLKDVLKVFARQIGANFLTTDDVKVRDVTVLLDNVPVEEALEQLLSANGLTYEYDQLSNIFVVKAPAALSGCDPGHPRVSAQVRDSGVLQRFERAVQGCHNGCHRDVRFLGRDSGYHLRRRAAVMSFLKDKDRGKVIEDPRTNSLIITDVQSNFPNIERVLARLDTPITQVMIEVEMLDVSKQLSDEMGMKFKSQTMFSLNGNPVTDATGKVLPSPCPCPLVMSDSGNRSNFLSRLQAL